MGARGPAPKRSDQRRRRNKAEKETASAPGQVAAQPPAETSWHPVARRWYESLAQSGQAIYYQASDWALAQVLAEAVSRELAPQPIVVGKGPDATVEMLTLPMKGATLAAFLKGCTDLLVSEASRRRAAIELTIPAGEKDEPADAPVTDLASWRQSLSS